MIDRAVLLAAGEGSRLRAVAPYKPLCRVGGKPLIDWALEGLAEAGIARATIVLGYGAEVIAAHLAARAWPLAVQSVPTPDWRAPNGVSALAGARAAGTPSLLAMCDHLVDPALYRLLAEAGPGDGIRLGVDRRLDDPAVDLADVTRVRTERGRIVAIGKDIGEYDSFDTGVFAFDDHFIEALAALDRPSVSAGVMMLAAAGRASVAEAGSLGWIDVDDPQVLAITERRLSARRVHGLRTGRQTCMTEQ